MKNKNKVGCITTSSHVIGISGGGSSSSSLGGALIEGDWLVCEILTRLSVKSLTRFKSVCKGWCSLIQHDQNFIDLHLTRSETRPFPPCRLYIFVFDIYTPYKNFHITADLFFEKDNQGHDRTKVEVDTVRKTSYTSYTILSESVKGLICLIDSYVNYDFRICNINTGEISPSIESTLLEEIKHLDGTKFNRYNSSTYYGFGFNPATNEHKLVCWLKLGDSLNNIICEVLTIGHHHQDGGNNRWRRITEVPPYELTHDKSVYVNGVIYWKTIDLKSRGWGFYDDTAHIVAFDVESEKFRAITISYTIPYQVRGRVNHRDEYVHLLQVDGRLAIVMETKNGVFHMYIDKGDYKQEGEEIDTMSTTSSFKNNESWSEVSIGKLPFNLDYNDFFRFDSVVGSSDMIILGLYRGDCRARQMKDEKKKCLSIYCCNWKKGSWTKLDVSGLPSSVPHLCASTFFGTSLETLFSPSQIPRLILNCNKG